MKIDISNININKVESTISKILTKMKNFSFSSVTGRYQATLGSEELIFSVASPKINKTKLIKFSLVYSSNGDIIANVSSSKQKNLTSYNKYGNIKSEDKLYVTNGIFKQIIEFALLDVEDNLNENTKMSKVDTIKRIVNEA